MEVIFQLFEQYSGARPTQHRVLAGSGSNRVYYRLWQGDNTYIGVYGADVKENHAFLELSKQFACCGVAVPKVLHISDNEQC